MSQALYELGGLRFWDEEEIRLRDRVVDDVSFIMKNTLGSHNPSWSFFRVEGPCLSPRDQISSSYDEDDIFVTNHTAAGSKLCLRAETTPTSYAYARWLEKTGDKRAKAPFCVWQVGKSFRRETNDGASAKKLRFNEFYQLEFQCIYSDTTKADYRALAMKQVSSYLAHLTGNLSRTVESDRLPSYSQSTLDIELEFNGRWTEAASCSIRTDYGEGMLVFEMAIGLDRVVEMTFGVGN
jgi:glycyl-tRNA synthetase